MNKFFFLVLASSISLSISAPVFAAVPQKLPEYKVPSAKKNPRFKVAMRVGIKGAAPISINTVARSGKKTFVSEISDDGQSETLVELYARKSQQGNKNGLYLDVTVTKRVRGLKKSSERTQLFAPENQEMEIGTGARGRNTASLSLAVMAHQL